MPKKPFTQVEYAQAAIINAANFTQNTLRLQLHLVHFLAVSRAAHRPYGDHAGVGDQVLASVSLRHVDRRGGPSATAPGPFMQPVGLLQALYCCQFGLHIPQVSVF